MVFKYYYKLDVLKSLNNISLASVPLLGGSLTKIVTSGSKHFVRYLGCPLLGGFTVRRFFGLNIETKGKT